MSSPKLETGVEFLQSYLQRNKFDFSSLTPGKFKAWLERQIQYKKNDQVFSLRCRIRDLKKKHYKKLRCLDITRSQAQKHYDECPQKPRLAELEKELDNTEKAVLGLQGAMQRLSGEKQAACQAKLADFCDKLADLQKEQQELLQACREKPALVDAEQELQIFREQIGLIKLESDLKTLLHQQGERITNAGGEFEAISIHTVKEHILPLLAAQTLNWNELSGRIKILQGVTLGCARAEIDYMVIAAAENPEQLTQVLAVVEVKRNINNVGAGFLLRQENLAWFTGDQSGYDPLAYRTRVFRSGHFETQASHNTDGETYVFDQSSFRNFKKDSQSGYFLDKVFFIARKQRLMGMHSKDHAKILYRVATDTNFDLENKSYIKDLLNWSQEIVPDFQTRDVIELYAGSNSWAEGFIMIAK